MFSKAIAYASLTSTAVAWVSLIKPVPFVQDGGQVWTNKPLELDGSDFPCHGVSYTVDKLNVYEAGSREGLHLKGSSVMGGGSCQISITTDLNPTKASVWKVIKSIEGGCPARDTSGNLPDVNDMEWPLSDIYNFTIPDVASGRYTLAWTWFNKVAQRQMHMDCAPIEITGGAGSVQLESLPDMFVANMMEYKDCMNMEGTDLLFPEPGADLDQLNGATTAFAAAFGTECTGTPIPDIPVDDIPSVTTHDITPTVVPLPPKIGPISDVVSDPVDQPIIDEVTTEVDVPEGIPLYPGVTKVYKYSPRTPCPEASEKPFNCIDGLTYQLCDDGAWTDIMPVTNGWVCFAGQAVQLAQQPAKI